jgi:MYXO-CTERM domain-containing protein
MRRSSVVVAVLALASGPALADQPKLDLRVGVGPEMPHLPAGALADAQLFLNRCTGGCAMKPGTDDASSNTSALVNQATTVSEYTAFKTGEWDAVVKCVREVYSPYHVTIADARPSSAVMYAEVIVGGSPQEIGINDSGVGGIANIANGCGPNPRGVAYAFTSAIDVFAQEDGGSRINGLCWIIAQESAHLYGLDHEFLFTDDTTSACKDPMTYRSDCGGQKFFRNKPAGCGEFGPVRTCRCGGAQNSHSMLLATFGAGTPLTPAPTVTVNLTANQALPPQIVALAASQRGVAHVDFILNGYKWGSLPGAAFGAQGQPESSYVFDVPAKLPNSIYDVRVIAYDDLEINTAAATVTVTKGGPCATADTCLNGQKCEAGKCFWDPPAGELGDSCTFDQFCKSGLCTGTKEQQICTQDCIVGVSDSCPMALECIDQGGGKGVCFVPSSGGCCSVSDDTPSRVFAHLVAVFVLGLVLLRRRRR